VLTGLIRDMLAQYPKEPDAEVASRRVSARIGRGVGAAKTTEQTLVATDLLTFLPDAIHDVRHGVEMRRSRSAAASTGTSRRGAADRKPGRGKDDAGEGDRRWRGGVQSTSR